VIGNELPKAAPKSFQSTFLFEISNSVSFLLALYCHLFPSSPFSGVQDGIGPFDLVDSLFFLVIVFDGLTCTLPLSRAESHVPPRSHFLPLSRKPAECPFLLFPPNGDASRPSSVRSRLFKSRAFFLSFADRCEGPHLLFRRSTGRLQPHWPRPATFSFKLTTLPFLQEMLHRTFNFFPDFATSRFAHSPDPVLVGCTSSPSNFFQGFFLNGFFFHGSVFSPALVWGWRRRFPFSCSPL